MRSSFVRKGTQQNLQGPGTRPGLHGQTLVSTGLAGLDSLLGGGLPLGSVLLVLEEQRSQPQCTALLKHFLAEGAACGQALSWATPRAAEGAAASFIPGQQRQPSSSSSRGGGGHQQEQEEEEEQELKIAWQYRRYIKKKEASDSKREEAEHKAASAARRASRATSPLSSSSGANKEWCHKFDLHSSIGPEGLKESGSTAATSECRGATALSSLREAVSGLVDGVKAAGEAVGGTRAPQSVGRAAIQSLGSPAWQLESEEAPDDLLRTLFWLRGTMRDSRCCACVTVSAGALPESWKQRASHLVDAVISVEALHDDSLLVGLSPDPATAVALLRLLSSPSAGALGTPPLGPDGASRLLRFKRRRLVLEEIDIDPDAEQALAEVGASSGGSTVSALACASPASKAGGGKLDF